ncbi:unnamed protein product [Lota lota]
MLRGTVRVTGLNKRDDEFQRNSRIYFMGNEAEDNLNASSLEDDERLKYDQVKAGFEDHDHWQAWSNFTGSPDIQVVGDYLTVTTNPKCIEQAVETKACNCLLLKVNQNGIVTESMT